MAKFPFARVAQGLAVFVAALASVATSEPVSSVPLEGGAPSGSGEVTLTQGSPSTTVDLTLANLDAMNPVLVISAASPIDPKLTPDYVNFPIDFVTVALLTANGGAPAGQEIDLQGVTGSGGTSYTIPMAVAIGRGCLCPTAPAPSCGDNTDDASITDDASTDDGGATEAGPADAGACATVDAGCDTCSARVRVTFNMPSGFTSLDVGYNFFVAQGTVIAK